MDEPVKMCKNRTHRPLSRTPLSVNTHTCGETQVMSDFLMITGVCILKDIVPHQLSLLENNEQIHL